ncbi:MAG: COX15/CtaA family protein [Verrucomicrobia bacterium]|nr:COX15/CtaA family protein [Verrucomicrobiota bacterium]
MTVNSEKYSFGRALFAKLICVLTLLLIGAGAVVTSKNVGLSVPDWPTTYGYHMWSFPFSMWRGGIFYEHLHRVIASALGVLVLVMAIWLIIKEPRKRVRYIGLACLFAVVVQGILGGMTVKYLLPMSESVFHGVLAQVHGVLAQVFLSLCIILAYELSRERFRRVGAKEATPVGKEILGSVFWLLILVVVQLVLAATMRHDIKHQGGVAIPDFPTVTGQWIPRFGEDAVIWVNQWREDATMEHDAAFDASDSIKSYQIVIHFLHRTVAFLIFVAAWVLTQKAIKQPLAGQGIMGLIFVLDGLVLLAISLGILTVWSNKGPLVTSLHVVIGACILGACVLLLMRAYSPALPSAKS